MDVHATDAAVVATRAQQVAYFMYTTGGEAHAAALAGGASEEEELRAAQLAKEATNMEAWETIATEEAVLSSAK